MESYPLELRQATWPREKLRLYDYLQAGVLANFFWQYHRQSGCAILRFHGLRLLVLLPHLPDIGMGLEAKDGKAHA